MKQHKPKPEAVVHPLSDGMVVTLSKLGLLKIKNGHTVEIDLLTGNKQTKFLLMRDTAWETKKKQIEKEKSE